MVIAMIFPAAEHGHRSLFSSHFPILWHLCTCITQLLQINEVTKKEEHLGQIAGYTLKLYTCE